jgi:hypothetical protein
VRGERQLLRVGEYLVGRACRPLPRGLREERYREWTAELPAILHDPQIRLAPRRAVRMLSFAADTFRGTTMTPVRARRQSPGETAMLCLMLAAALANMVWDIWTTVRASGHGLNYVYLTWSLLLVAYPVSKLARSTVRIPVLIIGNSTLVGVVIYVWYAAQAPGDWVNYVVIASLLVLVAAVWLARRWARGGHAGSPGSHQAPG